MNKLVLSLASLLFALNAFGQYREPSYKNVGTGVTNLAASVTNSVAGEIIQLNDSPSPVRIWLKAEGNLGTTNAGGITTTNGLIVYFSTASGNLSTTNTFDTALLSNIKLQIKELQSTTNTVSDWFELRGARYIKVGAIRNEFIGSVTNVQVIIGYPK
jgi:hypothetical protein